MFAICATFPLTKKSYSVAILLRFISRFSLLLLSTSLCCYAQGAGKRFDRVSDLLLVHIDSKTDVDDIHSVAAFATILSSDEILDINFHLVAGAYGIKVVLYVPANELFELSFDDHWSDAHADFERAVTEEYEIAIAALQSSGVVWIAECGQSNFSAAMVRKIYSHHPEIKTAQRIHLVQHSFNRIAEMRRGRAWRRGGQGSN